MYPLKVNQRRSVVETVVAARESCGYGLEAGSKPELLLAMAQPVVTAPIICNGYKDREFMRIAYHARARPRGDHGAREPPRGSSLPRGRRGAGLAGAPARRYAGQALQPRQRALAEQRRRAGQVRPDHQRDARGRPPAQRRQPARSPGPAALPHRLADHPDQADQDRRPRGRARCGRRLREKTESMRYIDLGGGIGVDYDGSRTSYPSSANYSIEEYASQVVFEIAEVCRELEMPHPTIVTESGRVLVSTHAVTITDLREVQGELLPVPEPSENEDRLITELRGTLEGISTKNIEEYFHDAVDFRDEALQGFSRGHLSLEDRASAEGLFQRIRLQCAKLVQQMAHPPEEILEYLNTAQVKYLANFSIFQSLPDTWSIDQVFPAAPLSGHGTRPEVQAEIVDITCDSDGCVTTFAHPEDNLRALPLHSPPNRGDAPYFLGFFMTGAYQDSLANVHNLFGRSHEVVVRRVEDEGVIMGSIGVDYSDEVWLEVKQGYSVQDVLAEMDYDVESVTRMLRDRHLGGETTLGQPWAMGLLQEYPYLVRP
ncbi:MAG: hypothetical protein HC927_06445 [Deltaproteobacteria bacterium]|nr:hypothetical protein [Deltaproteobacteria bacterium]